MIEMKYVVVRKNKQGLFKMGVYETYDEANLVADKFHEMSQSLFRSYDDEYLIVEEILEE